MLNISSNSIASISDLKNFKSSDSILKSKWASSLFRWALVMIVIVFIILLLPWTQNVQADGVVTNLRPEQRPQVVNSVIAGRIEKWYIQEGDYVEKGDTILFISEVKDEYFDPALLERTRERLLAQENGISAYMGKVDALDNQIEALIGTLKLKLQQARNKVRQAELKVQSDSLKLTAENSNQQITEKQWKRQEQLYEQGIKSLTDLENYRQKYQEGLAKFLAAENQLLTSRNELINYKIELSSIQTEYNDKIAKSESDKYSALSDMLDAEGKLAKTLNEVANYTIRSSMYFITSPQSGYITRALQTGIGETIKAGEAVVSIVPNVTELAVEMYARPIDLPLLSRGNEVRFIFDGWPSLVFSGWPNVSVGTYSGRVVAIDNITSSNGLYRILIAPNKDAEDWPMQLRMGSGAKGIALLNDVPIWYEFWRQLNGFPPEFYKTDDSEAKAKSK